MEQSINYSPLFEGKISPYSTQISSKPVILRNTKFPKHVRVIIVHSLVVAVVGSLAPVVGATVVTVRQF